MPTYFNETAQTWYCKFYYRDYQGRVCQKKKGGFKLQRDAKEWERSFIRQNEGRPGMTFAELYSLYRDDMKDRLRPTTMLTKEHLVKTKLLPYFESVPINQIDPTMIRRWQNSLSKEINDAGHTYSRTYLKAINNQLSAILNYAVRYYRLQANPCHAAGSMGKKRAAEKQFWSLQEFHTFVNYFDKNTENHLIFSLLYYTGIRIGELLALTYEDFYFQQGLMIINKSYHRIRKEDYITPPKTDKSNRMVALPDFLKKELQHYFSVCQDIPLNDRIFTCSRYYISKYMNEACQATGVKKIRIHDLRHSHASLLIEMGCSPVLIAERLGHENVETTLNTYSHLYPNKQKELASQLHRLREDYNLT